jgi:hypothetical protein
MQNTDYINGERWQMFLDTNRKVGSWKSTTEYEHRAYWWISDHGRIKVTNNFNDLVHWPRIYVTGGHAKKQYACLSINYAPSKYIHRLVAMYYVENPEDLNVVNHLDNNPLNNHYTNLEWCTHKQNIRHGYDIRKTQENEVSQRLYQLAKEELDQYNPRASRDILVISLRQQGLTYQAIANTTGVPRGTVAAIVHRWRNKHS